MKTTTIQLYDFNELSEKSKQNAISEFLNKGYNDGEYNYQEAHESVKKFNDIFSVRNSNNSWLDFSYLNLDNYILELSGIRLYKYIINNFYSDLFKPAYVKSYEKHFNHKRAKNKTYKNGIIASFFYSNLNVTNSCVLTGVCWDDDLLQPIYEFLKKPCKYTNLNDLIKECFESLRISLEKSDDYYTSDEFISETLQINNYQFTKDGSIY